MQAVLEPACHQVPLAARQPEHEQRRVGDVEDGVAHRHLGGQRGPRLPGADRIVGDDHDRLEPGRDVESGRGAVGTHDEPAEQGRPDVVGVALDLGGGGQQVGVELEQVVGGHHAGDNRRRARAEATRERDVAVDREPEVVGWMQGGEGPHAEVAPVAGDVEVGDDLEVAGLLHLDLQVQLQRRGEHVEAGAEIGRGRGHADEPAALHQPSTARSTASMSASQGTTAPACSSAVWGSFRPCPVSTHTTRSAPFAP